MALPNGSYFDNIRHTLYSVHKPPLVITDPIGYENSNEEFTRTIKNIGVVANFSSDLKFVNDGLDYIEDIIFNYGVNETITIKKEGKDPNTDEWIELYFGTLDIMVYENEDGVLSIRINSGGIDKIFKSRESESIEIESIKTLDEIAIPELVTKKITNEGREIFLKTIYNVLKTDNNAYLYNQTNGQTRGCTVNVPLNIFSKSHDNAQSPYPNTTIGDNSHDRSAQGTNELMFFANSNTQRNLEINLDISFKVNVINYDDVHWSKYWLRIAIYKDGASYNYSRPIDIWYTDNIRSFNGNIITKQLNYVLDLKQGESASLQFCQLMDGKNGHSAHLEVKFEDIVINEPKMTISESSSSPGTETKMLLMHELGERLSLLITGKSGIFKSNVLGRKELGYRKDGDWAYISTYCGHWLRGFDRHPLPQPATETTPEIVNKYKAYTTSFKDYSETLKAIFNIHIGFQTINGIEQVVAEKFSYFFNQNIVLVLPFPLTKAKRYTAEDFIYSSVEAGYEKGGTVEDIQGLDEPNGKSNWVSNITALKNPYTAISKYIAGVYAEEKQRQYQKKDYPTLDRDLDKDIFIKDCKLSLGSIKERTWKDDLAVPPTGIFSPNTAKNLRLSPANNLRRHGVMLSAPLKQYQNKYLAFGSSTSNSGMVTQPTDIASQVGENGSVLNSNLGNRIFEPFYIEGEHIINTEISRLLRGHSRFNGIDIPNFYCKVQFTMNDDPKIRYGWIMSVKPDGAGKWKIIEASN
ncbi:hypothetical protein [Flavobacterium sp. GT3P67]|uniref:hypothetical protein n=1 Tax=Flavobacterium sp. GT3P67 TaxID=2541722 RepID=UPI001043054F|nr:hypothetical protein [Flavobacterium sp. GT3P67]TDE53755.1 hypothetical protein E0H99_06995 [Flavobacterium sp. GT3P67]